MIKEKMLRERGDALFSAKRVLDSRNQDIAEHFYPERADFTVQRSLGDDFADHLTTGYPVMVRRDLGNMLGSILRPKSQPWFHAGSGWGDDADDNDAREWLEWAETRQRRAMYDRVSGFARATRECDHDFATFGQGVISVETNWRDTALLFRSWHLRDVAWEEDEYGQISRVFRNWKPTASMLNRLMKGRVHAKVAEAAEKRPDEKVAVRHVMMRADDHCVEKDYRQPWVSAWLDCENDHMMEAVGSWTRKYVIPRFATLSGSQYAYSPATVIALPDARLLQAMTLTLLDAGEYAARPPMVGVGDAIKGDVELFPGGFTSVDAEYDERLGNAMRPIETNGRNLGFGFDLADRTANLIREAFYLNTLTMPPAGDGQMTAFEVGQRVQEYIRQAMPLFQPVEEDYNGALCDMVFETLLHANAFGAMEDIPQSLKEVTFSFESPLSEMIERQKGQKFLESKAMIAEAVAMDESAASIMDFGETLRDVLGGIGAPAKWLRSEAEVKEAAEKATAQQDAAALLGGMEQSAGIVETLSRAGAPVAPVAA